MATSTKITPFSNQLKALFDAMYDRITDPLHKTIHEKGWERFQERGLPTKKDSGYHYFPLSALEKESFDSFHVPEVSLEQIEPYILPSCRLSYLVFLNGQYAPHLSDTTGLNEGVIVTSLGDALETYGPFLQARFYQTLQEEKDPFALLNLAYVEKGVFIYVPPGVRAEEPLQCIHVISNDQPTWFSPRTHVYLGKEASIKVNAQYHCLKDFEYLSNHVMDVVLEEKAAFNYYEIASPCPNGYCLESVRVSQKKESQFNSVLLTKGTKAVRHDYKVSLEGERASCDLKGMALLSKNRQAHTNIHMEHKAPNCTSNQLFKNVVTDSARASFEGKIYIHPEAQKTMAYQLNQNLLLNDKALVNSRPNLEIFADDVKASHGATVTKLSSDHLLYLQSRGIGKATAEKLLLRGFIRQMVDETPCLFTKEKIEVLAEEFTRGS